MYRTKNKGKEDKKKDRKLKVTERVEILWDDGIQEWRRGTKLKEKWRTGKRQ